MEKQAVQAKLKFAIEIILFVICVLPAKSIFWEPSQINDGPEIRVLMEEVSVFDTVGEGSPFLRVCGGVRNSLIEVVFDTLALYGKVTASLELSIFRD